MFKNNVTGLKTLNVDQINETNSQQIDYIKNLTSDAQTQINNISNTITTLQNNDVNQQSQIYTNTQNIQTLLNNSTAFDATEWQGYNIDDSLLIFENNNYDITTMQTTVYENKDYNTAQNKTLGTFVFQPKSYINAKITIYVSFFEKMSISLGNILPNLDCVSTLSSIRATVYKDTNTLILDKTTNFNYTNTFQYSGAFVSGNATEQWFYKQLQFDLDFENIFLETQTEYMVKIESVNETHSDGVIQGNGFYWQVNNLSRFQVYALDGQDNPLVTFSEPTSYYETNNIIIPSLTYSGISHNPIFQQNINPSDPNVYSLTIDKAGLYVINNQGFITTNNGYNFEIDCVCQNLFDIIEIIIINPSQYQSNQNYFKGRIKFSINYRNSQSDAYNNNIQPNTWVDLKRRYYKFQILPCATNATSYNNNLGIFEIFVSA